MESSTCWTTFLASGAKRDTASNWSLRASSGPRSSLSKSNRICTDAESHSQAADDIERGLGSPGLIAAELNDVDTYELGELLLR